ncbi:hypothetical protein CYK00_12075 [Neisseria sicca]|uniref:Uncharacterized protein n=1 Tax=Neisseria sicca TaxID=490 RepID=A0A2I1X976_NEISI|nr:hypothetical protein CYK00_12075 [Neisseria sicca]
MLPHTGLFLLGKVALQMRIRRPFTVSATLFLPPSGGGRLGWGWLRGFRQNQIRATHRATLSPTLSRWTGEGAGCMSWRRFLPNYRHSRVGGNLLLNFCNCFSNISFLELLMDSRRSLSSRMRGRG